MSSIPATQRFITIGEKETNASSNVRKAHKITTSARAKQASVTRVAAENPNQRISLPSFLVPLCSSCGCKSEPVEGAIFIGITGKTKEQVGAGPLLLWKCGCCKKYEVTSSAPTCIFKRLCGVRKGGDFKINIERRATYNTHGKITLERTRIFGLITPLWYIGYVPVKSFAKD